jgi:hypothetical protein
LLDDDLEQLELDLIDLVSFHLLLTLTLLELPQFDQKGDVQYPREPELTGENRQFQVLPTAQEGENG